MILVFSIYSDPSTNDVCNWFSHYEYEFYRVNSIQDLCTFLSKHTIMIEDFNSLNVMVESIWYRRRPSVNLKQVFFENPLTQKNVNDFINSEQQALYNAFCTILSKKKWLNKWNNSTPGKVEQLMIAQSIGIRVPATALIGNKKDLEAFLLSNGEIITKPIQDVRTITIDNGQYSQFTSSIRNKDIAALKDDFFPNVFQKNIKKNMEIRSFYLDGNFYSMAICSSFDKQTQMDFRRYNDKYPNRTIPYQLPAVIEKDLDVFMNKMNLNCGSIDLILDNSGDYYFLEVNPVGQFGMVSYPCNYYLERAMASWFF